MKLLSRMDPMKLSSVALNREGRVLRLELLRVRGR
jgi:hypothetical protein